SPPAFAREVAEWSRQCSRYQPTPGPEEADGYMNFSGYAARTHERYCETEPPMSSGPGVQGLILKFAAEVTRLLFLAISRRRDPQLVAVRIGHEELARVVLGLVDLADQETALLQPRVGRVQIVHAHVNDPALADGGVEADLLVGGQLLQH